MTCRSPTSGSQSQGSGFNGFSQPGVRHRFNKNPAFIVAGYFTRHSTLGMTDPNPGIDLPGVNPDLSRPLS